MFLVRGSVQFISVVQSRPTVCNPTDCSKPGFPLHHQLLEYAQIHVHWVSDAIQPSHPCHPLLLLPSIFPSIRIFSNELTLYIRWPKYWRFSFSISLSNEWWSPWGHKESDTTEQLKNNNKMWKEPVSLNRCMIKQTWSIIYRVDYWYTWQLGWVSRALCWAKKYYQKVTYWYDSIYIASLK